MKYKKAFTHESKLADELNKYKVQCKCGTKTVMFKADKTICRGCGFWLYRTKKIEFREKIKEKMKNG